MTDRKKVCRESAHDEQKSEEEEEENDSDMDDDNSFVGDVIDVEFEGRNPIEENFHGIKLLLQQLFLKAHINLCQLTDLIIGQNYIGSVVMQCEASDEEEMDDDDEMYDAQQVFGITTVVNLTRKTEMPCLEEIQKHILQKCEENATQENKKIFKKILQSEENHVGYLINERFVNIPPNIAVPLLQNLVQEIKRAKGKNKPFDFAYYLIVVKMYKWQMEKKGSKETDSFLNAEEELVCNEGLASFDYCVQNEKDSGVDGGWGEDDSPLIPYRRVVLFPADKMPSLVQSIEELLANSGK